MLPSLILLAAAAALGAAAQRATGIGFSLVVAPACAIALAPDASIGTLVRLALVADIAVLVTERVGHRLAVGPPPAGPGRARRPRRGDRRRPRAGLADGRRHDGGHARRRRTADRLVPPGHRRADLRLHVTRPRPGPGRRRGSRSLRPGGRLRVGLHGRHHRHARPPAGAARVAHQRAAGHRAGIDGGAVRAGRPHRRAHPPPRRCRPATSRCRRWPCSVASPSGADWPHGCPTATCGRPCSSW